MTKKLFQSLPAKPGLACEWGGKIYELVHVVPIRETCFLLPIPRKKYKAKPIATSYERVELIDPVGRVPDHLIPRGNRK